MRFLMIGDDLRQQSLTELLQKKYTVSVFGAGEGDIFDALVLPCPSFDAAGQLRAAYPLSRLAPYLRERVTVFCCGTAEPLREYPVQAIDLLSDEIAVLENARLTAEAALTAVTGKTQDSLHGKRCLTVGYGRIGTFLARLLRAVGAECTVFARREVSRTLASCFGYPTAAPGSLRASDFDFVFNTVPAQALSLPELAALPETCLWVELASSPGGLPKDGTGFPFSVLPAGGLPGKYIPNAAARVLYAAIERQIGISSIVREARRGAD